MNYVAQVSLGSGGAIQNEEFILNRLPYAKGLQYMTIFRHLRGIETKSANEPTLGEERL